MNSQELAPIVFFAYNRPEHTHKTIEALKKNELAHESLLYIFADGPKINADNETLNKINEVRQIIHSISGFKDITIVEQETNIGLDTSVIQGVSDVLNKHSKCITIEDDVVTHPFFLRFMNDCLNKYENDKRICMVGGYNNRIKVPWWYRRDVYIVHRCCSWGWGIWKDRWDDIDWNLKEYERFLTDEEQIKLFCRGGNDMIGMLKSQMLQKVPAWDIRFDYTLMKKNSFVVRPIRSLVVNYGLDGTGVHCGIEDPIAVTAPVEQSKKYKLKLPNKIKENKTLERRFKNFFDRTPSLFFKVYNCIRYRWSSLTHRLHTLIKRNPTQHL